MTKLIQILFILLLGFSCFSCTDKRNAVDLSKAFIQASPTAIQLRIDTSSANSGLTTQTITFTNIGRQPATQFVIKNFKDESAPLSKSTTCDRDLAAGGTCAVVVKLNTNHKLALSKGISRTTTMDYEFNDGEIKKLATVDIRFSVEKWIGSMFLTSSSTDGRIKYQRSEDLPPINFGIDSADYYCQVDKNNPKNGYVYNALLYDTMRRTPYLHWVLFGGQPYFSVMPNVYHQKVWQSAYRQAIATNLLDKIYNCISTNCTAGASEDGSAWTGLRLNNNSLDTNTCGTAGIAWQSNTVDSYGKVFALKFDKKAHAMTRIDEDASCNVQKKIICVSM